MMPDNHTPIRLLCAGLLGLCLLPATAAAETEYGVTMRMVMDDEELDSSFVQEMEIPESLNQLDTVSEAGSGIESLEPLELNELADESQTLQETLSSETREIRDALDELLPGEEILEDVVGGLPDLTDPDLLPGDGDLNLLDGDGLDLLDGLRGDPEQPAGQ